MTSTVQETRHWKYMHQHVSNTGIYNSTYKDQHTIHRCKIKILYIITDCKTIASKRSPTKILLQFYSVHCKCSKFTINLAPWQRLPIIQVKWILTFSRLTTYIYVVPHRWHPDVAFYIFIQQIYVLNILNMLHTLRFFLFKMPFIS